MMDEQRLKAVIDHANEIGDTAPTLAAYLCATVAEVRRLQQQAEGQYCPFCWEQAKNGHTADCALAALLAQEEQGGGQ